MKRPGPRARLEIADGLSVLGLLAVAEIAYWHLHGWPLWTTCACYFVAFFARAYVYRQAKAGLCGTSTTVTVNVAEGASALDTVKAVGWALRAHDNRTGA